MQREQEKMKRNLYGENSVYPGLLSEFTAMKGTVEDMKGTVEDMASAKTKNDKIWRWGGGIAAAVVTGLLLAIINQLAGLG